MWKVIDFPEHIYVYILKILSTVMDLVFMYSNPVNKPASLGDVGGMKGFQG